MPDQRRFELGRRHLVALVLDQLLQSIDQEQVAVLVDIADVAGVQPAFLVEHLSGRMVVVQVAAHHLGSANPDLTGLLAAELLPALHIRDPHLGARKRGTDRTGPVRSWLLRRRVGDRARLRQPVTLEHHASEPPRAAVCQLCTQRSRPGEQQLERREVVLVD